MASVVEIEPGLGLTFARAVAVRFIEIAVRYRRAGWQGAQTLDFTLTDRNTSSLLSLDDPFERVLGHRLLREWDILREGRAPNAADNMSVLPALLALWDLGTDRITGAWLQDRRIDPRLLTEVGFLVPAGWEKGDLIDDENIIGPLDAQVLPRPEGIDLKATDGQTAPVGSPERYRVYRVRAGWVAQHLREQVAGALDTPAVEELNTHALFLGFFQMDARDVPLYLVRSLEDQNARASIDTELRSRGSLGIGLVLQAGRAVGSCLAANVLTPILDHIDGAAPDIILNVNRLKAAFRRDQSLARGGQTVQLERTGANSGTLFVPGKGSIDIPGDHRLRVIERLVDAYNTGPAPVAAADLIVGMEGPVTVEYLRKTAVKLKADFVRTPKRGLWEISI